MGEGLAVLERALAMRQGVAASIQARALHGAAFLALMQDDYMRAGELLRECQSLFRQSGDRVGMANILLLQGNLAMVTSSYKLARRLLDEALAIYRDEGETSRISSTREALAQAAIAQCDYAAARSLLEKDLSAFQARGEQYRIAYPLYLLARVYFLSQLDLAEARARAEESLAIFREVGDKRLIGHTLSLLGEILLFEKREASGASSLIEESVAALETVGDRSGTAAALIALARVRVFSGEYEAARRCYQEAWQLLRAARAKELGASCLEGYGEMLVAQDMPGAAAKLWGAAATVRAAFVAPMPLVYRAPYNKAVALARDRLGAEDFQQAWAEGHALPLEQVELA
jgi:tetratricopeptide (TPR) repeat protein